MSLFVDIGQGAGLAGASGIRPFLAPLAAGGLAGVDAGIDFEGTDWSFLESPGFLAAVLVLTVLVYALERRGRMPLPALAALAAGFGGMLFAGALAAEGHTAWPGLPAGAGIGLVSFLAAEGLLGGARERLRDGQPAMLGLAADLATLAAVALALLVPVAGYAVAAALAVLFVRRRAVGDRKYEGLRVLR